MDVDYCGTPWRWRWPHRIGFVLSALGLVLAIVALTDEGSATGLIKWALVSLSLGATLSAASSLAYQRTGATSIR